MTTFTKEQMDILTSQANEIMKEISEGKTTRDIMVQIYVDNLDDKTQKQGQIMADSILKSVKEFDANYDEAQKDIDRFIKKFQDKIDQDKTCVERCNYWLKLTAAITAATVATGEENTDMEKILEQIETMEISESEATPKREKELREQALEAIKNSGVMLGTLTEQAEELEKMETAEEAVGLLIDLRNKEIEYRGIVSMLAYTKIKNGEFDNVPVEMTAVQVATLVCAEIEQAKIMEAVGKGNLAVDIASGLLTILGAVVLVVVATEVAGTGVGIITVVFGTILAIPATLMLFAGILRGTLKAIDLWEKDSKKIVKGVAVAVKAVIKGLRMVAAFVMNKVIPKIVETCKSIKDKVMNVHSEEEVKTEVVVN